MACQSIYVKAQIYSVECGEVTRIKKEVDLSFIIKNESKVHLALNISNKSRIIKR